MRFIVLGILFLALVSGETFVSIKRNKLYAFTHFNVTFKRTLQYLDVYITPTKKSKHLYKKKFVDQKIHHNGKSTTEFLVPLGKIIFGKNKKKAIFHGEIHIKNKFMHVRILQGECHFQYENHTMAFVRTKIYCGVKMSKTSIIDMSKIFYQQQKETSKTAVIPGACQ